ncbi:hypothetical protein SAMN06264364_101138 [Quadrisphaera granulorum]|uniref:Uncharacterized protein n=1 Tax=Quadrisphaera granulorum TaxID=317664 RepID=A0A316AEL2_9ACTN|nr:hypothetical protein [Quadrisphaera granulorum]PWJ56163.1 hypothetical protein BXY45_101138 [Quadrisphaera granulorum]SZE94797.1 hypothetical protein SAMN06264364_101138 [Quadrisphaera granulorum]
MTASGLRRSPLVWLAAAMLVLAVPTTALAVLDPVQITGTNGWVKPLKFELSIALYGVTLAWLITRLRRGQRLARALGAVAAALLAVEMVIIIGAAVLGTTSHFNVSTPAHAVAFAVMGVSIAVVWLITAVVGVLLWRSPSGDAAFDLSVRAGVVLSLAGMAVAFLMTSPTSAQLADFRGISGAHTVGAGDGGPGLPLLGWSTVAGDLRVPHFVGMHALQGLPLLVLALSLVARRWPAAATALTARTRLELVTLASVGWGAALGLLTWQALAGQSVTSPAGGVLVAGAATTALLVGAAVVVLLHAAHPTPAPPATPVTP